MARCLQLQGALSYPHLRQTTASLLKELVGVGERSFLAQDVGSEGGAGGAHPPHVQILNVHNTREVEQRLADPLNLDVPGRASPISATEPKPKPITSCRVVRPLLSTMLQRKAPGALPWWPPSSW
jgi:hypothetical protein